jgi:hypothetical protein
MVDSKPVAAIQTILERFGLASSQNEPESPRVFRIQERPNTFAIRASLTLALPIGSMDVRCQSSEASSSHDSNLLQSHLNLQDLK